MGNPFLGLIAVHLVVNSVIISDTGMLQVVGTVAGA